ncbi:hypothetical protein [Sphingomonas pokkalii]|uniref:hypothetical protein n=1 Tax=Sphingomonas pokkalii TaxID=2175090 RepID=UPI001057A3BA|nr:hypothetical protein [Sphingomonas pokkalii]
MLRDREQYAENSGIISAVPSAELSPMQYNSTSLRNERQQEKVECARSYGGIAFARKLDAGMERITTPRPSPVSEAE